MGGGVGMGKNQKKLMQQSMTEKQKSRAKESAKKKWGKRILSGAHHAPDTVE